MTATTTPQQQNGFWTQLAERVSPTAYKPQRREHVIATRLQARSDPYYVLKQPLTKSYLRLSEEDYALWWQMNGRYSVKDLLFYSLKRYRTLPIGHLTRLVDDLRDGYFLHDPPTNLYEQVQHKLEERTPASRGRRLLNAFLHTEVSIRGLNDVFTSLHRRSRRLFTWPVQLALLLLILVGGLFFGRLVWRESYFLTEGGGWSIISLMLANLVVIFIHELGHGLMTKHVGRELHRGGILIYWGMPAFFVDTRDTWLSPPGDRILVSAAGPYTGLVLGGWVGIVLTAVSTTFPAVTDAIWATFLFHLGFIAYFSVIVNLNPLLELDGYFILMDWLDMPGLRRRAFRFWRTELWQQWQRHKTPGDLWQTLDRNDRIFTLYGALAFVYSAYALWLAVYFWQSRLGPFVVGLWRGGVWGQLLVLGLTAVLVIPALYYLFHFVYGRLRAALDWLAHRDLLARPDVLALLTGLPLLLGLPALFLAINWLPHADIWATLAEWGIHLAAVAALAGVARQLPGSRFQWAMWSLTVVPVALTLAWMFGDAGAHLWRYGTLTGAGVAVVAAGTVGFFTVLPRYLELGDRLLMLLFAGLGLGTVTVMWNIGGPAWLENGRFWPAALLTFLVFTGLLIMSPLLFNFGRSRFALPWLLLILGMGGLPWLLLYPALHLLVAALWLYAGLLYLLLGALAQFARHTAELENVAAFQERERLVNAFNHFLQAMFAGYEPVFGGRRLAAIQAQIQAMGALDPDNSVLGIANRCEDALLLAVDRLDDLAGTPFTRKVGQAAYDSLPWLEAETLGRHVLANTEWGASLAQGFIRARDRRALLVRQADIFAGFDRQAVDEVVAMLRRYHAEKGERLAEVNTEAKQFFLIESGQVGVFHDGVPMATLEEGGYFGMMALLDSGNYQATYRTLTPVTAFVIDRDRFDPLLRADTTLAQQVSSGARERRLLKQMLLFSSLSPQQLAAVDARLQRRLVAAGEVIVRRGQPRDYLYIIAQGEVEAVHDEGEEGERVLGRLGPGEHFGEYALFADTPYQATYRATGEVELLLLDEPKFDELVASCDKMTHYVEQIGTGRLIATRRRVGPGAVLS